MAYGNKWSKLLVYKVSSKHMERLEVHPINPQSRLIAQAVSALQHGQVIAYPTESGYALGCALGEKAAIEEIRQIRQLPKSHNFTLMCRNLSEIANYAIVDNQLYRYLKDHTPGAYTFILRATKQVPRRLLHPKRKSIGIRVSPSPVVMALLDQLDEPIMSVSLMLDAMDDYVALSEQIFDSLLRFPGLMLDTGDARIEPTQVIDCTQGDFVVLRD